MGKKLAKALYVLVCAVLIVQLAGCGTILYPERRGQAAGRMDVGIVVLDGLGLLLFIIPGVIAYAVDFSNGTIYIPNSSRGSLNPKDIKQVKFDHRHATQATIEKIIKKETGCAVKLDQDDMHVSKLESIDDMMTRFAEILPAIKHDRIALSTE